MEDSGAAAGPDGARRGPTLVAVVVTAVLAGCLLLCCAALALRLTDHEYWSTPTH